MDKQALVRVIQESIPGINKQGIAAIMGNIRLETDNFKSLTEYGMSHKRIFEKKNGKYVMNIPSIRKNLTDNGYGENASKEKIAEYNGLSNNQKLGISYMGDKDAAYGGGTGPLMITFANYGGNEVKKERMEQIAKDMGYTDFNQFMSKVNTDAEFGLKATLAYYKKYEPNKFTAESLNNTTAKELGDETINPGRNWIPDKDTVKDGKTITGWATYQQDGDDIVAEHYYKPIEELSDEEIENLSAEDREYYNLPQTRFAGGTQQLEGIKNTVQLAVARKDKGHLSNKELNKLEKLGYSVTQRAEGDFTYYEIQTKDLEEADKITKHLKDNGFKPFVRHEKIEDDGSLTRIKRDEAEDDVFEKWKQTAKPLAELTDEEIDDLTDRQRKHYNLAPEAKIVEKQDDFIKWKRTAKPFEDLTEKEIDDLTPKQREYYNLSPDVDIEESQYDVIPSEEGQDWNGRVYDSKTKKWYNASIKWNEDKSDYKLVVKDYDTGQAINKDSDVYKSLDKEIIEDSLRGENRYDKHTDGNGQTSWTSYGGHGRFQLVDKPLRPKESYINQAKKDKEETQERYNTQKRNKVTGADDLTNWEKENKELKSKLKIKKGNLQYLSPGSARYNRVAKEIRELERKLAKSEVSIKNHLYQKQIESAVAAENDTIADLKAARNEAAVYADNDEAVPAELAQKIKTLEANLSKQQNRVKLLQSKGSIINGKYILNKDEVKEFSADPVQQGNANKLVLNDNGSVNVDQSNKTKSNQTDQQDVELIVEEDDANVIQTDPLAPRESNEFYSDLYGNIYHKDANGKWTTRQNKTEDENYGLLSEDDIINEEWTHQNSVDKGFAWDLNNEWQDAGFEENSEHSLSLYKITDRDQIAQIHSAGEPLNTDQAAAEGKDSPWTGDKTAGKLAGGLNTLFAGINALGGPSAIVSYIMGKKGLEGAMKQVKPLAHPELSPLFMQHFIQTKELAKQGFTPTQERKIKKDIDNAYQVGLENAVRGTGGQRARFLAQSGVLDVRRANALLEYAASDDEVQKQNQSKYAELMLFKENFDLQKSEKMRAEDMERQTKDKEAAAAFSANAFQNVMDSMSGNSSILNMLKTQQMKKLLNGNTSINLYDNISNNISTWR